MVTSKVKEPYIIKQGKYLLDNLNLIAKRKGYLHMLTEMSMKDNFKKMTNQVMELTNIILAMYISVLLKKVKKMDWAK